MRQILLAGSAVAALVVVAPGRAQSVATEPATDGQDGAGLQDIIVTAQKRPEIGQKAPLAVTSLSADALAAAHVTGATDLQRVVPNLTAELGGGAGDPGGANTLFSIRGLGASATGVQGSAGVAAHFDGVYRQDGISNAEFFDLERIEVDPGPQGTLYGRSAAAGAINILPSKPVHQFEAAGSVTYGNYNALTTQGMINVPLSDTLALRAAFQTLNHDGYYSNGYDDQDAKAVRLQLLFTPTPALSVRLYGSWTGLRGRGSGNVFVGGPAYSLLTSLVPQAANSDLRTASISEDCVDQGQIVDTCQQKIHIDKYSAHAEISYDFGGATLTLVPAYSKSNQTNDFANAPLPLSNYNQFPFNNEQVTVESRLSDSGHGKLKWVVGGNYYRNNVDTNVYQFINALIPNSIPLPSPPFPPGSSVRAVDALQAFQQQSSTQKSYAFFGQATYPVFDKVRLTVGGRYNHDRSSENIVLGTTSNQIFAINAPPPLAGVPLLNLLPGGPAVTPSQFGSKSFNAFTYRVAIDVDVGPKSIVYASVGSGYKPGGLNDGGPISTTMPASPLAPQQFFGPEKVTHFEFGSKNRFFGNKLQVNNVLYYDDYSNYQNGQTQVVNPLQFGALGFVVTNAGKARVYGDELSVKWQATPHDIFDVSGNYLNAKFTRYLAPAYLGPAGPASALDISGFPLPNAPKFSGNVSYQHIFDLTGGSTLTASAFSHISDGYWVYFAQAPGSYQGSHTSTTLDLTWTNANRRLQVSGFVSNLENHDIKVFGISTSGVTQVGLAAPRTYGGRVSFKF